MHKTILSIFIAALLCLLSCSPSGQDDPFMPTPSPDAQQTSISFGGKSGIWQDGGKTRASALQTRAEGETGLESLFNSFKVWGYKTINQKPQLVMNGYQVNHQAETDWEYKNVEGQSIKYWDYSASDYRFFAYAPANAEGVEYNEDANLSTLKLNIPYKYSADATNISTPYLSELWLSDNQASSTKKIGETVKLTFAPLTAKVRFKFTYPDNATEEEYKITDISFRDNRWKKDDNGKFDWSPSERESSQKTPTSGTIIASYPLTEASTPSGDASSPSAASSSPAAPSFSWTNEAQGVGPIELTIPYEEADDKIHQTDEANRGKWYYVPPFEDIIQYSQGSYIIAIKLNDSPISTTVASQFMQWRAGYQYTYTFKVSERGNSITFANVQVEEWNSTINIENNGSGTKDW